jgi:hypothetical protein
VTFYFSEFALTWTIHQSQHKATIDAPPAELGIEDAKPRSHAAKKSIVSSPLAASDPMQMMQQMMGMFMGGLAGSMALSRGPQAEMHVPLAPPSPSVYNTPGTAAGPLSSPASLKRPADHDIPKNIDIEIWLSQLDADPVRGKRNINYTQFGQSLTSLGIYELSDIVVLDVNQLQELVPRLNFGIANRLVTYAQEDYPMHKRTRLDC